ncbi:DUF4238 domain-containing protein [Brucepastera parasyntrophica]|uniref:DUF4238 domain-containing protein n=1 Tax=Brucepastera parasyntrophica TaxID=2880008 RepID=UPI00210D588A|nr:DUF4238 domain-containing protein [Brucepastera parasyntrophica]ULQ61033.1 DUF4238 domain-containing protein [Brucepastera parasyntrophica]
MKKSQHYIWRNYLKPWTDKDKIWCLRENKLFFTALENIGQENYFYEALPLNSDELNLLNIYISKLHPTAHRTIKDMLNLYIFSSGVSIESRKQGIEDYHTKIEERAIFSINKLYQKDCTFFDQEAERLNFSTYLGFQYSRTNKIRNNIMRLFEIQDFRKNIPDTVRPDVFARAMSLLTADTIGNWAYSKSKIFLLENNTQESFITGDQPIINLKSNFFDTGEPAKELVLYYPVTPNIAIIIAETDKEVIPINIDRANYLNNKVYEISQNQIYSNKENLIKKFITK